MIEVKLGDDTLTTDAAVYRIEPGCLYILRTPELLTEEQIDQLREVFAQDKQVLDPPATFLIMGGDFDVTKAPDDYVEQQIRKYQAVLEKRRTA
jgi:hypothetical protein